MADMGGTNIRFAIFHNNEIMNLEVFKCADFSSFEEALICYEQKAGKLPKQFVLAVPGVAKQEVYRFVNNKWQFLLSDIKEKFGFKDIVILNDFEAVAYALPTLDEKNLHCLQSKNLNGNDFPYIVMGFGTGLGVGMLLPIANGYHAIPSEGGHIGVAPQNETEQKIYDFILKKYGRVSAERVISAQGLENVYQALTGKKMSSTEIVSNALSGKKDEKNALLQMFAFWGDVAGNLALSICAKSGVYLTGNIFQTQGVLELLKKSDFIKRFCFKGRHTSLVESIPVYVVDVPYLAFQGMAQIGLSLF